MATESRWRRHARAVIAVTLAALPEDAPEAAVRKALRAAYPFGEREMYPYRCWLAEQKKALADRFPPAPDNTPGAVRFVLRGTAGGAVRLDVACTWCRDTIQGGCLLCFSHHQRVREVVADPAFRALRRGATDEGGRGVLCDWLEERGVLVPGG